MAKELHELGENNPFIRLSKEEIEEFGRKLDAIKAREVADYGQKDRDYLEAVDLAMKTFEKVGRALIYVGLDPITLGIGTASLSLKKILDITHAHNVYHRQFDSVGHTYDSKTYESDWMIDTEMWKTEHNSTHHPFSNEIGKDSTLAPFGIRFFKEMDWHPYHALYPLVAIPAIFTTEAILAFHVTGVGEYALSKWAHDCHVLEDETPNGALKALRKAGKSAWKKIKKDYVLEPLKGGIFAPKIAFSNFIANSIGSGFFVVVNLTNHTNQRTYLFREGDVPKIKGAKYIQQILSTSDSHGNLAFSVLAGYFNYHTIHHIYPNMPAWRYRKIAPEIRALCAEYGIPYAVDDITVLMKEAGECTQEGFLPNDVKSYGELMKKAWKGTKKRLFASQNKNNEKQSIQPKPTKKAPIQKAA